MRAIMRPEEMDREKTTTLGNHRVTGISPQDIIVTTFASKKKSGWSMEPDTGVKIYHKPTGKTFSCEIYKSTHRNKAHCVECLEKSLVDGVSMKTFRIDREITSSDGTQSFACKAENAEEAAAVFENGGGVLIDHEHTVEGLEPVECCEVYETDERIAPYNGSIKPQPKVKPLVWEPVLRKGLQRSRITASNSMIDIYIEHGPSSSDLIVLSVHCQSRVYPNLNKAREAAQEHYEKLILESIDL